MTITGITYIKISAVYFAIGVLLGMYMSMAHDYKMASVHAHVNLLGWASFALAGIIYWLFPKAASSVLGKIQFWAYSIGLPIMMIGLAFVVNGKESFEAIIPIGAVLVVVSVLLFAINVFINVSPRAGSR